MTFFRLTGITLLDRLELTKQLEETLASCSCWITDSHLYSNISLCLMVEVPLRRIAELSAKLSQLPIRFEQEELSAMTALAADEGEAVGTIQLTFVHDEPDLRRKVPPIPG